ncbi:hypothetical protein INR49_022755 [Caranx melampygus]|nr:hypothetical protein INR49_022755 [Caranx melampygus]
MAAGLVHAVTRSCSQGNLTECGCDTRLQGSGSAAEGWHWGGCSDHIQYGTWFSRKFIDSTVKNTSTTSRGGYTLVTMNQHNTEAGRQNFCSNSTVLKTRTSCRSCSISLLMPCPTGYKLTPGSTTKDCKYQIRTASLTLSISGCSSECYREVEVKSCCPGTGVQTVLNVQISHRDPAAAEESATMAWEETGPAAVSCQQNSRCMEEALTGRLVCQCLPGYEKSGDQCLSMNPCLRPVCHAHASCVHTGPNQHLCACHQGFTGDGRICSAIDPCQTRQGGCSPRSSKCVYDGPGKSHCECLPGFDHLTDGGCSLTDSCRHDSCHRNANCSTVAPGQIECTCLQGYLGNGKVCFGNIVQRLNELNTEPGGLWTGQLSNALTLFGSVSWPLQNLGPFTVFIPINKGFRGNSVRSLISDPSKAKYLCKMHLVAGVMPLDSLKKSDMFYTLTGKSAETDTTGGDMQTNIRIHGSRRRGTIVHSDVVASNGMIHLINKLMDSVSPTVESDTKENLMKIISDYGKFDKFKSLLEKTDLASILDLPGPVTVFAPTTSAFDAMTDGHLSFLSSAQGHNKLVELLRNHLVPSTALEVYNIVSSPRIVTMANQVLTTNVTENGQILVNGAAVLEAAVEAKNGRLYVVDRVLTPPSIEPVLPHRCDITETKTIKGNCVSCSKVKLSQCSSGVFTGSSIFGCVYTLSISFGHPDVSIPATGCSPLCNTTVTTPACCKGFFGPDCAPCPGGYQTPCSGHGQCMEGIGGNGLCVCESNFRGSRCQYCSSSNKYGPNCDTDCPCVHGQCDNRPDSDGRCKPDSCLMGFSGRFCERQTAACGVQVQFCHAHAVCDFSQGMTRCVCKPGYQGDGITCVESDPCAPPHRGGCSVNAKCVRTGPGTRSCQCLTGWKEDGDECQPINNCDSPDRGDCHPNATCIYVGPGQSDCSCKPGFKGRAETVSQSTSASLPMEAVTSCCRLLSSRWTCVCDEGFAGDGQICFGSVDQELMNLPDASEFFTWATDSGLTRSLSEQNLTILVPSSAAVAKMSPDNKSFWTMKGNLPSLIRNHMISGRFPLSRLSAVSSVTSLLQTALPVSTTNEVTAVGGASITTSDLAATNGVIHIIDKVLVPDRKLSDGLLAALATRPEFSLFRSHLIEYNLTEEIQQANEFTVFAPTDDAINDYLKKMAATALDVNTTRYHVVPSERLLKTDLLPGGYKQTLLGFSFQLGFFPRDGKLFVNEAQVTSSNLLSDEGVIHGLSAVLQINRNRCDEVTYLSVMGNCVDCLFPQGKICPNNTIPAKTSRVRKCMFTRMFEEEHLMTIGCRATCLQKNIVHRCCEGFFGEHCEPCPGPKGRPCFGNGVCVGGTTGTGACQCNTEVESTADDLCGSIKCHTSANCVIGPAGPQCLCAAGFQGNGTSCQAKDPCAEDNGSCSLYAVCKRTLPGRRECVCNSGYYGDGLTSCACSDGYSGDGHTCEMINLCRKKNGGCHQFARCNMTGPGVRTCTCFNNFLGDGLTCRGTVGKEMLTRKLRDFYLSLMIVEISLKGRGPFTVFAPTSSAFNTDNISAAKMKLMRKDKSKERFASIMRSHIVMCHTLLPADLSRPRNLTSLSGHVLTTSSNHGNIFINDANVTYSHDISTNGIFHEIDQILLPPDLDNPDIAMNLTDVAKRHGYQTFFRLLQDTGVMDQVNDGMYQPVTVFLPSDAVMASLPQEQKDFLFHQDNQAQLVEYLKYHIIQAQKIYAEVLIHLDSARTLQGSSLSFSCGGVDDIGEIFVNDGRCRVIQRHLIFNGGIAYGIDCLLTPPSLGGRCDVQTTFDLQMSCGLCTSSASRCPRGSKLKEVQKCDLPSMFITKDSGCRSVCTVHFWQPKCCHGYHGRDCLVCPGGVSSPCSNHGKCDDGHLGNGTCTCDMGFRGVACEHCRDGFYGPTCKACKCSEHGSCDDGRRGTGLCFCEEGWVVDICNFWNGGCAKGATCSQSGVKVSCTCPKGHRGDGYVCQPIDLCDSGDNSGCHEHATCTMTAPGKRRCTCKDGYVGDGLTCEVRQLPVSRCLDDNGQCHQDAQCTDLHFEDSTLGVFHLRSEQGQYRLNFSAAQQACAAVGGSLATYTQLSYAQQGGLNMCAAGWLAQARVAYPTTYSNPNCGFGHVGIVDYGVRKNLSETWDTFCYRMKEVRCECRPGFIGDGFSCTGNLLQVLRATPTFSNFLTQILNLSESTESGKQFVKRLSDLTLRSTLFVPDNDGLPGNQTLSQSDIEFHLAEGQALSLSQLNNGTQIRTRAGTLTVRGVTDLLNPSALASRYINDRFVTSADILAANGIIHVLQGPLKAPPPRQEMHMAHRAGLGVGVVLLVVLLAAVVFVGYHFYRRNAKPFRFHYFREDDGEEEEAPPHDGSRSICNPVYEAATEPAETKSSDITGDRHQVVDGGVYDLLQDN